MKNIVIAIDSFKGSLTSLEAGQAIKEGFLQADSSLHCVVKPLADGGEGTVEALCTKEEMIQVHVHGPLHDSITCYYGIHNQQAIIEMSACAGITLLTKEERNPYDTTTYGVGEIILDALDKGIREFVIGIGGSCTNDGGVGMLQALGYAFLDENEQEIPLGAIGLSKLKRIDDTNVDQRLKDCVFRIATDVTNPLCGKNGASSIYGPQKGADVEMVQNMDTWLQHYANITKQTYSNADETYPGSGAAGGLGFAFHTFLHASLQSGIQIVLETTKLEKDIQQADLVVTGEGRLDEQTAMGKAPIGVAKLAKKYNKPVIAFAGSVTKEASACNKAGIDAYFPIVRGITTLEEAMCKENAKDNLIETSKQVMLLIKAIE